MFESPLVGLYRLVGGDEGTIVNSQRKDDHRSSRRAGQALVCAQPAPAPASSISASWLTGKRICSECFITVIVQQVNDAVSVRDDYMVRRATVHLTLARGSGENIRFSDREAPQPVSDDPHLRSRSKGWSLGELGMEPGDELYFFVRATRCQRQLRPQRTGFP
jgi:hypothetical protein